MLCTIFFSKLGQGSGKYWSADAEIAPAAIMTASFDSLCGARAGMDDAGPDSVRLLDDQTFETLDRFGLETNEVCCAAASMSFSDDPCPYYVVGTAITVAEEPEPTKVRCL